MPPLDSNLNKNQLAVDFPIQIIKHFAYGEVQTPDDGKGLADGNRHHSFKATFAIIAEINGLSAFLHCADGREDEVAARNRRQFY